MSINYDSKSEPDPTAYESNAAEVPPSVRLKRFSSKNKAGRLPFAIYLNVKDYFRDTKKYEKQVAAYWRFGIMILFLFSISLLVLMK